MNILGLTLQFHEQKSFFRGHTLHEWMDWKLIYSIITSISNNYQHLSWELFAADQSMQ